MVKIKKKTKFEDEAKRLKEQLARALADYDNLRKRVETEVEDRVTIAKARFIIRLLSVFDMLVDAQKHLNDSGLAIITEEFKNIFKDEKVEEIEVKAGDEFDEEICEAVEAVDSPAGGKKKSGTIAQVILTGWKFSDGMVIRPVKVKVYRAKE